MRASYAFVFGDGVWLVDPLVAPDIDGPIRELGSVVAVAVCFSMHARDAGQFASRYDVPVSYRVGCLVCRIVIDPEIRQYDEFPAEGVTVV